MTNINYEFDWSIRLFFLSISLYCLLGAMWFGINVWGYIRA